MSADFIKYLLKVTESSACNEIEIIQSLWSGYGKISRYQLKDSTLDTVVVKNISLNQSNDHPRGWDTDNSHQRKVKSYEVETYWYERWNQQCSKKNKTPKLFGSYTEDKNRWIILEDLNADFPLRKESLEFLEVKVCLSWLANFHASFLNQEPTGLWEMGTYWHLQTRPDELAKMEHQTLKEKAHLIDSNLNECQFKTIIHGDAKLANFCFSENGENAAAVDFQYVGGGCGMKDVAYFLGSCLSSEECALYEKELLDFYFNELQEATMGIDFAELEEEWRKLYPFAIADFTRFLLGWMPTHQKVNDYHENLTKSVLLTL